MKIIYHCLSCKKDFVDIDLAKEHSKSLHHELAEEAKRAPDDDQPLDVNHVFFYFREIVRLSHTAKLM
jgi:hypothetical protein